MAVKKGQHRVYHNKRYGDRTIVKNRDRRFTFCGEASFYCRVFSILCYNTLSD